MERPPGCELLGFEGEMALIIGKTVRRVSIEDAWSHVGGATVSNGLGVYDVRWADNGSNLRSKGDDGATPIGPAILNAAAVDPAAMRVRDQQREEAWGSMDEVRRTPSRRTLLTAGLAATAAILSGCTTERPQDGPTSGDPTAGGSTDMSPNPQASSVPGVQKLLVYFSRAGENYYYGGRRNLDIGNTEVLAGMITDRIGCDTYKIEAADPYPDAYDPTAARNSREQDEDARPAIANPLPDVSGYGTVLIGSPVWGSRAPMILSTLIDGVNLDGKIILPFVTYAVSGMSGVDNDYRQALPGSEVRDGLAVQGETVTEAAAALDGWLTTNSLA